MGELSLPDKFWKVVDTYFYVYTHRIYQYADRINGQENKRPRQELTGIMPMFTVEGFSYQQQQSIHAINRLADIVGFPAPHFLQPYLAMALLMAYAIWFYTKFKSIFTLLDTTVKIDKKASELLEKEKKKREEDRRKR